MSEIFQLSSHNINKVSVDTMKFKATRPKNMALDNSKIKSDLIHDISDVQTTMKFLKKNYGKLNEK